MDRLPLFPLKTVLFPGGTIPVHVFEQRYRTMIGRCIDERAPFGVVLIRSGEEVGGPAETYDIGTSARIVRVQRLPDGAMNIVALGRRRFRILADDTTEAYPQGDIEYVETADVDAPGVSDAVARIAALFAEDFRLLMAVTGQWVRHVDLPADPARLADFIAAHVDVPVETKQELLEALLLPQRLAREEELLGERIRELAARWEERRRRRFAGAALN